MENIEILSIPEIIICFHERETHYPNNMTRLDDTIYSDYAIRKMIYKGEEYVYIEYKFEYEANGAIGLGYRCFPKSKCLGYHEGDREHLILLLNIDTLKIEHVFFKAHGRGQGMWLPFEECEKNIEGKLIVYVARESHAFYPYPKTYWRVFGLANDLCSEDGKKCIVVRKNIYKSEYEPQLESITDCERFCLPFGKEKIRNK